MEKKQPRPTAFLDRDGVLNLDTGYIHRPADFNWLPGAKAAIRCLNDAGYLVIVITNQAGVARGLYSLDAVDGLHRWINDELAATGAHIDAFYVCPHHPTIGQTDLTRVCDCRKPAPGMLLQAMHEWPIDRAASFMIGDKDSDLAAAQAAGVRGVAVELPLDTLIKRLIAETQATH